MKSPRQKVTDEQVHLSYDKAKHVYEHSSSITKAAFELHSGENINQGTANDFLRIFHHMLAGSVFKRALSRYAMDYFLLNISKDYGSNILQEALSALMKHILYREEGNSTTGRKPVKQKAMRELHGKFTNQIMIMNNNLENELTDEKEQSNLRDGMLSGLNTGEKIEKAIAKYSSQDSIKVTISTVSYKRFNVIISLIKKHRNYKCQICGISIKRADGSEYIEAAHIKPHHLGGKATLQNIILLCPNHHKEFDLGETSAHYSSDKNSVDIVMNGKSHTIALN